MELVETERVLEAVAIVVDARDSVGGSDSKMALNGSFFWCSVRYGVRDELAVGGRVEGCEMVLLGVCGLVRA